MPKQPNKSLRFGLCALGATAAQSPRFGHIYI